MMMKKMGTFEKATRRRGDNNFTCHAPIENCEERNVERATRRWDNSSELFLLY